MKVIYWITKQELKSLKIACCWWKKQKSQQTSLSKAAKVTCFHLFANIFFFFFCLLYWSGIIVRMFSNGLGDLGSIPGQIIPKTQKMVLDASLLNTQHYKVRWRVKWSNPGKGVAPSPTSWCSSYWKGSLWVTLDYGRQLYFFFHFLLVIDLKFLF